MQFTKNEKGVLKLLLDNGRVSDIDMASKLKISTQAVGKIRRKLEDNGVIESYSCNLNFEKLGINQFALAYLNITDKFWGEIGGIKGRDTIKNLQNSLFACIPPGSETSAILLKGFRDAKEMDRYFHIIETSHSDFWKYNKIHSFSNLNFLKNDHKELFKLLLDGKPIVPQSLRKS